MDPRFRGGDGLGDFYEFVKIRTKPKAIFLGFRSGII